MKKQLMALAAALLAGLVTFAADPGGHFGFVKATVPNSFIFGMKNLESDATSDVFAIAKSWVVWPEEMYADTLPGNTIVAYGAYMYMEAGVQYDFKGCYDAYVTVKIDSTWVLSKGGHCQEQKGSFTPPATDWYKIDLRVASDSGAYVGGCRTSSQYGILWKKSTETTWHKFVAGTLFKTGETSVNREKPGKPTVEIVSAQMRETDPTVMDVKYCVWSAASDTVNVRALAFQDGVRSFANVVRPAKFLDGSQMGDGVPANAVNSFAWQVSADWDVDLAKVAVEVFAQDVDAGLVPLDLVTIPAHGDYAAVTCSTNIVTDAEFLDALYWLYADGDEDLTLKDGWLRDSQDRILVKGNALQEDGYAAEFVYGKMGFDAMGTNCKWPHAVVAAVERIRRMSMLRYLDYSKNQRYMITGLTAPAAQTMGSGLYMVVDLNGNGYHFPVTYMDAAPAKWGDEYKTNKIVLRRIDDPNGVYYVGVFEITEAQWAKVMGGSSTSTKPKAYVSYNAIRGDASVYDWPTSNEVSRNSFMGALRLMTGLATFDLPSEAEWEFAARAGVTTKWLCGDSETGLDDYAWYSANSGGSTYEVGTRQPNAWGLYDVHGNVFEWCLNWSSDAASYRVLRGGAYLYDASYCAFPFRYGLNPSFGYYDSGFRLSCRPESN